MTKNWDIVTTATALGCGTVGGVFFAFSAFVMSGITRLPDDQAIAAMKSINVTAVRPLFMLALFGTAALCVAVGVHALLNRGDRQATLLLIGACLYLVGIVVTIAINVPINDRIADLAPHSDAARAAWHGYAAHWLIANHVRTITSLAAMVVLVLGLLAPKSHDRGVSAGVGGGNHSPIVGAW